MFTLRIIPVLAATIALASFVQAAPRTPGAPTPLLTKRTEPQLLEILKSEAPIKDKADACRELGVIGSKAAVDALAAMLPDEKLNHIARYALEPNPDPAVDAALRDALGKLQGRPLVGVIGTIGVRRDAQAVAALSGKLGDADADVAQAAARALGKIGTVDAAKAIQGALSATAAGNQVAFYEGLFRAAEALAAKGQAQQALAIYDPIRTQTQVPHQVRAAAVRGAIINRPFGGPNVLQECLADPDYAVFAAAVRATMEMPGPQVTQALVKALTEGQPSNDRKIVLIRALGPRATPNNQVSLPLFAKDGDKTVRLAAIRAGSMVKDPSAAWLQQFLNDPDREIAQAALDGFASLPGAEIDTMIVAMLSEPARRPVALELISRRHMTAALPALFISARDGDPDVRPDVLRKIGELGGPAEVPKLLQLLRETDNQPVVNAIEQALIALCGKAENPASSVEQVIAQLAQVKPVAKAALLRVLSAAGGANALQAVRNAVKDSDPAVRSAAVRALGDWKTADAAPDLLALAKGATDPKEKMLFLRSFLGVADNPDLPIDQRLAMCRQASELVQKPDEKKLLLGTLGGVSTPDVFALIQPHLADEATKNEAASAIVTVAERLLKGRENVKLAGRLIEPLQQAAKATTNADLAKRAQAALRQAQNRANQK